MKRIFLLITGFALVVLTSCYAPHHTIKRTYHRQGHSGHHTNNHH